MQAPVVWLRNFASEKLQRKFLLSVFVRRNSLCRHDCSRQLCKETSAEGGRGGGLLPPYDGLQSPPKGPRGDDGATWGAR